MSHTFAPSDVLHYYGECNLSLHPIKTTDSSYQEDINCVFSGGAGRTIHCSTTTEMMEMSLLSKEPSESKSPAPRTFQRSPQICWNLTSLHVAASIWSIMINFQFNVATMLCLSHKNHTRATAMAGNCSVVSLNVTLTNVETQPGAAITALAALIWNQVINM